jgi:UDP-N-acetylenolpyruvoylglucosamine reductase
MSEPLARRTTLRVGGCADVWLEPRGEEDLAMALVQAGRMGLPWMVIGRGSNLLVRDGGIRGLVIALGGPVFTRLECIDGRLECGAGVRLKNLANAACRHGLAGLEFLSGIPGGVGGALRMNAGAWSGSTFDWLESVRFMEPCGVARGRPAREVPASYRRCELFRDHIALGAVFRASPSTPSEVKARMDQLNQQRWASQPAAASAGCIFRNPPTIPAGRLVEELGMKGARVGGASVSEVHGNFIINDGGATAADVLELIARIQRRARDERGIILETEVEMVGEGPLKQ